MNNPLVSILVPVFNVEPYIERCARSLFEQTYHNLEYIFCDDCSTDASIHILESVMKDYPQRLEQIRIIHHERNRGSAAARNTLIDNCKGDFCFWVDSDDWVDTNAIEQLVMKQREKDADIVTYRAVAHYANGEVKEYFDGGWDLNREALLEMILKGKRGASVCRRLIRRCLYADYHIRCIEGVNGRDDFQLIIPLVYYSRKVDGINAFMYHYRREIPHSITYDYMNNLTYQIQSMTSRLAMRDFFAGKDDHYVRIVSEEIVWWAHKFMMNHYQLRNRKGYQTMVDYIDQMEREYWKKIKWDNEIIRCMEHNYYIMCLTYPIRNISSKLSL